MGPESRPSPIEQIIEFLARGPSPEEIGTFRLSDEALARVRDLLSKNQDGTLTSGEVQVLDQMILLDDLIALIGTRMDLDKCADDGSAHP